jgi:hypothetical protein
MGGSSGGAHKAHSSRWIRFPRQRGRRLTEDEVVAIVRAHIETKFPRLCSKCGRTFASLKDYLRSTTHVGAPISYDADLKKWRPCKPVGTLSFANCPCGTTLAISSDGMGLIVMWRLLRWVRRESARRNIGVGELLNGVREEIDRQVLREADVDESQSKRA